MSGDTVLLPGARLGAFRIRGVLGEGGGGRVFRAWDSDRGRDVALKTMHHLRAESRERIRREFRSLEAVRHPNVVTFYELNRHAGIDYFTMRLVEGRRFLETAATTLTWKAGADDAPPRPAPASHKHSAAVLTRWVLQLVDAIDALHGTGLLHMDVKPSNLMVDERGRLILVDFGLATRVDPDAGLAEPPVELTPAYSAPERHARVAVGPASDWYSVGATLHHALAGFPPRRGRLAEPLLESAGVLGRTCAELLHADPSKRADGARVREILGADRTSPPLLRPRPRAWVGRQRELTSLLADLQSIQSGHTVVLVRGERGAGKTALLERFAERARECGAAAFVGRAREWESVPFGLFEDIFPGVDLTTPADAPVPAVDRAASLDLPQVRADLRGPTRKLEARLDGAVHAGPSALIVDDFQWCDADSARLLISLLTSSTGSPLLTVVAYRASSTEPPIVEELRAWLLGLPMGVRHRELALSALHPEESRELARRLWAPVPSQAFTGSVAELARRSGGVPGRMLELAGDLASSPQHATGSVSLDRIHARAEALPITPRLYLELAVLCGRGVSQALLRTALGAPADELEALARLRAETWISTTGPRLADRVEVPDFIRNAIEQRIAAPRKRALHFRLARAMRTSDTDEPGALARHYAEAGLTGLAGAYALTAAHEARQVRAFHRAAQLYRSALEWSELEPNESESVRTLLAHMLAACGRGREAATAWLGVAHGAERDQARRMRLRAVEQLLTSGHFRDGRERLQQVSAELGLAYPRSPAWAAFRMAWGLFFIVVGPDARRSRSRDLIAEDRVRGASVGFRGLMPFDPLRAACFATQAVRWARRSGSNQLVANTLISLAAGVLAPAGGLLSLWGRSVLRQATRIVSDGSDPALAARVEMNRANQAFWSGAWRRAHDLADGAARALADLGLEGGVDRAILNLIITRSLEELGRWNEAGRRTSAMYRDALERGDRYALVTACLNYGMISLARDAPDEARSWAERALASWPRRGMHVQHVYALRVRAYADLYDGRPLDAWHSLDRAWPALRSGRHLRLSTSRIDLQVLRGRTLLHVALHGSGDAPLLRKVRACVRDLERVRRDDAVAHAHALRAGLRHVAGRSPIENLTRARWAYERCDQAALAQSCATVLATTAEQRKNALAELRTSGIAYPERWCRVFVPGYAETALAENPR